MKKSKEHPYYKQGWLDAQAYDSLQHKAIFAEGKEAGIKEAQAKYNLQQTMLEAMKQQTAGMEMLTRLASSINILSGGKGLM